MNFLPSFQWTKIFDAEMFCRQLALTENPCNPCPKYPRPSFTLSLGQRVTDTQSPQILVSVTVTIQRAHQLVQIGVDNSADVKISNATSLDETARSLARALKEMQINWDLLSLVAFAKLCGMTTDFFGFALKLGNVSCSCLYVCCGLITWI